MNFLDFIPEYIFEFIGILAGFSACLVITLQIIKEYKSKEPSTLSFAYTIGWGIIYLFWCLYGIRFDALALWLTNAIAIILQIILYIITKKKEK